MSVAPLEHIPGFTIDRVVPSGFGHLGTRVTLCLSDLLEQRGAAAPRRGWGGEVADRHVRFVFSNDPVERLALLRARLRAALAAVGK